MRPRRQPRTRQAVSGRVQMVAKAGGARERAVGHRNRQGLLCAWTVWGFVTLSLDDRTLSESWLMSRKDDPPCYLGRLLLQERLQGKTTQEVGARCTGTCWGKDQGPR
jgi:hypothetical protein